MKQEESAPKGAQQLVIAHKLYNKPRRRRQQIERIKAEVDHGYFYRSEIDNGSKVDSEGWIVGGDCPFNTACLAGEFEVNLQTGRCRCKCCESETDALGYLMQRRGLKFPDALHFLKEAG